ADVSSPVVSIVSLSNNQVVSGIVNINVSVSDDGDISRVLFYIDGVCVSTDTTLPYSYSWDTLSVSNGTHTIRVVGYDTSNNTGQAQVVVNVNNVVTNYTLTVNIVPQGAGNVNLVPSGGVYVAGSTVTLTALANEGYRFSHWSGGISSTSSVVDVVMDSNKEIVAHFSVVISTDEPPQINSINLVENQVLSGGYRP
ncbi:MAG: Ig-like domain-containing protein, partial [Candidatus Kryptonium sp.]